MPPNRYRGPPMTLANMRENGARAYAAIKIAAKAATTPSTVKMPAKNS
jgi:hypothetical protein